MYATFDLGEAPPNFDCTLDPQDDIEGLLSDNGEATEPTASPASQANRLQEQQLQKSNHASQPNAEAASTREKPGSAKAFQTTPEGA